MRGRAASARWIDEVVAFRDWDDPMPVLAGLLQSRGLERARIGLDFGSYCMPAARLERLRAAVPQAALIDVGAVVAELRLIKSPAEIATAAPGRGDRRRGAAARGGGLHGRQYAARCAWAQRRPR